MKRILLLLLCITLLSFSLTASAETTTVKISLSTGQMLRGGSSMTTGWCSVWKSTAQLGGSPAVQINGQDTKNNLTCPEDDGITLAEGATTAYTYTVSAPSGYVFMTMEADVKAGTPNNVPTVEIGTQQIVTTADNQTVTIYDIKKPSFAIKLTSASSNATATFTNFNVTLVPRAEAGIETQDPFKISTDEEQHWYYIVNRNTNTTYSLDKVMIASEAGEKILFGEKAFRADRIWSFWAGENGKVSIKNYNGLYIGRTPAGTGNSTAVKASNTIDVYYTITPFDDDFTIEDGNGQPLHAQNDNKVIVRWKAESGNASLWNFEEVDVTNAAATISGTQVQQGKVTTGIGNKDQGIVRSIINVAGLHGTLPLSQVKGKVVATDLADVAGIKAYMATNERELFVDANGSMTWREQNGTFLASGTIDANGNYTIDIPNTPLGVGSNYLWIALDIADAAKEGNKVDVTITKYTIEGKDRTEASGNPQHEATIFLTESAVLMPMDKGSKFYRIPAITTTADGKRLVTLTDDRLNHDADLPSHCYVVAQYSDDGGRTWSDPKRVAGTAETGGNYGHGDAQIITNRYTGEIIGIMTSSPNGNGFFGSTVDKPQGWKVMKSSDGGETWTVPVDHTASLYAKNSPHPEIKGGFSGSGAGLQKRDGTLISPFVARNTSNTNLYYNFISRDGGDTWEMYGKSGITGADEPKALERNNGDIAISIRSGGYNFHNVTSDDGLSWQKGASNKFTTGISGNACDGEYMVWCSTLDGNPWNVVLQTLPNSGSRQNVSIALSTNEGTTFGKPKTICPRGSAYSTTTILPDGTLGCYYEENGVFGDFTLRFVRFSLDWASNGQYKFTAEQPYHPVMTNVNIEIPEDGWQTLVLPFEADIPKGMTAYTADGTTETITENGSSYRALVATKVDITKFAPHTPYLVHGTSGNYNFQLDLNDWKPTTVPANCELKNGVLRGFYVKKQLPAHQSGTVYGPLRSTQEGITAKAFRQVTSGKSMAILPFTCTVTMPATDEEYLYPATPEQATGIQTPWQQALHSPAYTLQGTPHIDGTPGIVIKDKKKFIIK